MRIDKAMQAQYVQDIENAEDKSAAIVEVMEKVVEASHQELVDGIVREAEQNRANADKGFRPLSSNEKKFYEILKGGAKQAVTANQIDILPVETVDWTLNEVKKASNILSP